MEQIDWTEQPYGGFPPFAKGSDTSFEAAAELSGKVGTVRRKVYECIAASDGLTDEEMEARLGMKHQTASARRCELVILGLVADSTERRVASSGRNQAVWKAVPNPPRSMTEEERGHHRRMKERLFKEVPNDNEALRKVIRWLLTGVDEYWESLNRDKLNAMKKWLDNE